ncbi:unnamed protein product (macronuclear) [Paramecium tetraurelia]|uniref:Uncharacterized protein n=1 Tax=Paramecium tetraurelia TaxID=5888 RepID=A0C3G7_PARTE|nr:uncharacterized protein GSPATT00034813001 [Paramecium tetraurelia]CAK65334.1 unnamed protein product [Paramecium tetraurelia]|eukprot:XP_001432731.1 hypothetical protein (macronuclear) [Paramecium tetraurelia strain d4-2]
MKSFRTEEPLSTNSKNKGLTFEIGNQSTTRKQQKMPFQFNSLNTEECDNDTHRSQQAFKKLKNLEFQNELFMLEMQHGQRRKEAESNRLKFQLSSIKSDIDFMKSQLQSPVAKVKPKRRRSQSIDSEQSSNRNSSSSSDNSYVKCPIKFKHQEPIQKEQIKADSYETIGNRFKQLFQISDVNDKLNWMVKQYFNSFHSIQLDLQNNLLPLLLENTLKLLIEIIEKLNSIKLDTLQFKSYDPFQNGDKNIKGYSSDLDIETINQEYQFQGNQTLTDYCQKFTEQKNQFSTPQYKQQQPEQKQSARQLQNMMKSKPDSSCHTSNNQTLDKKVSISERSQKKTTQKTQLMPSLKNRQK